MIDGPLPGLKSVAVFCGSNFGISPEYENGARALGKALAEAGICLIYGGTNKGLMGAVANAALAAGGAVVGVITERLFERGHLAEQLSRHEIVGDMRIRKARMAELADAFIALPGGLGTLEELFEAATLTQLGDHVKACGVLNIQHFFDPMLAMLARATQEGFMKPEHRDMIVSADTPAMLLNALASWQAPSVSKWIGQPGA